MIVKTIDELQELDRMVVQSGDDEVEIGTVLHVDRDKKTVLLDIYEPQYYHPDNTSAITVLSPRFM